LVVKSSTLTTLGNTVTVNVTRYKYNKRCTYMENNPNDQNQSSTPQTALDPLAMPTATSLSTPPDPAAESANTSTEELTMSSTIDEEMPITPSVAEPEPTTPIESAIPSEPELPETPATSETMVTPTSPNSPVFSPSALTIESMPPKTDDLSNKHSGPTRLPPTPETPAVAPQPKSSMMRNLIIGVVGVLVLIGILFGVYAWGHSSGYTNGKNAGMDTTAAVALKVPANATIISQCSPGEGTQYVLPKDIPEGPIYNMWNNKITGIEYMLGQSKIAAAMTQNLALMGQQYNHVDVMYEAAGHAGFTEPHYHVIFSLISYTDEQKITCESSSSSMM